ncbi:MAG: fibronectin type III domain-containing protein, partial [Candidatus Zixiibacteriota bacterium]
IAYNPNLGSNLRIFANPSAMDFVNLMIGMANTYTYLNPYYAGQSGRSDHYSFYQWGYDAVFAHEAASVNNTYHNNYDVIDSLDFPYFREVVKMSLATLSYLGGSPSQVGNLRATDAGDGSTVYLSWSENPPAEEVLYYNVRFGTASGVYDSLRQTSGPADTLRDLVENTTYFITVSAVDVDGLESMLREEVSVAPRVVPLPPSGMVAQPEGRYKIRISWSSTREADFDYYEIYRSEESGSAYQLLSSAYVETTFVDSALENEVPYYYYTLTTVDTSGNESQMSDEVEGFAVTLDQGILVVDETYQGSDYNMVEDDSINAFYDRALQDYTPSYLDHSCQTICNPSDQIHIKELVHYSVVIVHSEDNLGFHSLGYYDDPTYPVLKEYLDYGGKVIIEGRRNLCYGGFSNWGIREFSSGDIQYDYLKVKSAYVPIWSSLDYYRTEEFIGASSQVSGYPDLQADSLRVAQCSNGLELAGKVPGVGYIDSLMQGEVIYTFRSAYDTSGSEGKPVAFRLLGEDLNLIFFDFPLYFIQEPQATELLHRALSDLGASTDVEEDGESEIIPLFWLKQNYPNPFNSETIIEYALAAESRVRITVYNILGQRVKTLLDRVQPAGRHNLTWNGENERGDAVSSGIYFYRIEAGEFKNTRRMLFLK